MTVALVIAAGVGARMKSETPKQFLQIHGKPVVCHTLERFQNCPQIDKILLVTLPQWFDAMWDYAHKLNLSKLTWMVSGGETGHDSIHNGVLELADRGLPDDTAVMIHDGVRPMVSNEIIAENLKVYREYGSAVTAIPCTDVMFRKNDLPTCYAETPRSDLMRTQTPQTYSLGKLIWAHKRAAELNLNPSATCALMAALGERTVFSPGCESNVKLTTPGDFTILQALLGNLKKLS